MFGPSCLLVYAAAQVWHRTAGAAWRQHVERALAPMAIGLTFASAIALMRGTEHGWPAYAITTVATLLLSLTEVNPLCFGGAVRCCWPVDRGRTFIPRTGGLLPGCLDRGANRHCHACRSARTTSSAQSE